MHVALIRMLSLTRAVCTGTLCRHSTRTRVRSGPAGLTRDPGARLDADHDRDPQRGERARERDRRRPRAATWLGGGRSLRERRASRATARSPRRCASGAACRCRSECSPTCSAAPAVSRGRAAGAARRGRGWPVPPTFVEGSPVGREGIAGVHVLAARGEARSAGEGETRLRHRRRDRRARACWASRTSAAAALGGSRPGPAEEAGRAIEAAEELLAREGFSFRDVARTWFYLRDILDWYGPFNAVRNAAFRRMGLMGPSGDGKIPASTGIEGRNARGGWCALDLLALQPRERRGVEMTRLHNRKQNEATEYGSAFARAMEVVLGDARYMFVSGTASIDDHGATVHVGDFETQTRFTLEAVQALLEGAGASLADVRQATAFLKNPCDGRSFERIVERSALRGAPLVTTVADVCRDDLLFEIDATAVVPLATGSGGERGRPADRRPLAGSRGRGSRSRARRSAAASRPAAAAPAVDRGRAGAGGRAAGAGARRRHAARRRSARAGGWCSSRANGATRVLTRRLRQRRRSRGLLRRQVDPVRGEAGEGRSLVRLGDEGRRQRRAQDHLRRGRRAAAGLPVDDLHDHGHERGAVGAGRVRRASTAGELERGRRRAEHQPVVVQDRRQRAATADVQPVERHRPGDPAGRPHGLRGLAAPHDRARAAGPGRAARRERGRHRLPAVRRRPGPAREADAGADGRRPTWCSSRSDAIGGGRRRTAGSGQPDPAAAQLPLADGGDGRPVPRARAAAGRAAARGLAAGAGARSVTFGIYRFDPATGAREKLLEDPAWHSLQAKLVAAAADARRPLERRARGRRRGQAVLDRRQHQRPRRRGLPKGAAKRLRVVEGVPSAEAPRRRAGCSARCRSRRTARTRCRCRPTRRCSCSSSTRDGLAIRTSAWLWVRNHDAQGCVGCHEDPERTPPNRFVKALQAPAPVLNPPAEKRRSGQLRQRGQADRRGPVPDCHGMPLDRRPRTTRPAADEVRAFVESLDLGGLP